MFHCTYAGGGVNVPPPPDFSGVIPPYNSRGNNNGSSSGNSSSGSNNESSNSENGYYGGGSNYGGNGSNRDEGGGGGGSSSNNNNFVDDQDNPCPEYGGMDFTPAPVEIIIEDPYTAARKRFAEEKSKLLAEVEKYTQIPDGTGINLVDNCASNARAVKGNIEGYKFYIDKHLTDKDRISILYHEIYHIKHHETYKEFKLYKMKTAITLQNVPPEFKQYIMDHVIMIRYLPSNQWEQEYLREISIQSINPPEYYLNEIQAYENEISTITNVSAYYSTQRRYMLWRIKKLYDISKNYYGK